MSDIDSLVDDFERAVTLAERHRFEDDSAAVAPLRDQLSALVAEVKALRASFASQAQVTVTARQAVSDVVVQRDAALAELGKTKAELRQAYLNMQDREFMRG